MYSLTLDGPASPAHLSAAPLGQREQARNIFGPSGVAVPSGSLHLELPVSQRTEVTTKLNQVLQQQPPGSFQHLKDTLAKFLSL